MKPFDKYGIFSAVGNTPLIPLNNIIPNCHFNLFAKLEFLNPGGSIKDRVALGILKHAWETGVIDQHSIVVESSSGNFGIGLAYVCKALKLKFICVVDPNLTEENYELLTTYGADIQTIDSNVEACNYLQARIDMVKRIIGNGTNYFWCNQYANLYNPISHHRTMAEIARSLNDKIDYLFCATSTCGTLRGCYDYSRQWKLDVHIVAVDAEGSVIFGGKSKKRLLPGHGAGRMPELYVAGTESEFINIGELDSIRACRDLLNTEAILAGGSSGAVISAIQKKAETIPPGKNCVVILCDRGERYLNTVYSNDWVFNNYNVDLL